MIRHYRANTEDRVHFVNALDHYYPELKELEITFDVVMALAVDKDGAKTGEIAVKSKGVPATARIKKTTSRERALGLSDLVVEVDVLVWEKLTNVQRLALADHEFAHVEIVRDKEEEVVIGVDLRPKLSIKPHDAEIGIFYEVMERHGHNALDFQVLHRVQSEVDKLGLDI